jgi:hypothetical protein
MESCSLRVQNNQDEPERRDGLGQCLGGRNMYFRCRETLHLLHVLLQPLSLFCLRAAQLIN